jgi:hypothetical protein
MLARFGQRLGLDLANVLARDGEQRPTKAHSKVMQTYLQPDAGSRIVILARR